MGCTASNLRATFLDGATGALIDGTVTVTLRANGADLLTCSMSNTSSCTSASTATINNGDAVNFSLSGYTVNNAHVVRVSARCQ